MGQNQTVLFRAEPTFGQSGRCSVDPRPAAFLQAADLRFLPVGQTAAHATAARALAGIRLN